MNRVSFYYRHQIGRPIFSSQILSSPLNRFKRNFSAESRPPFVDFEEFYKNPEGRVTAYDGLGLAPPSVTVFHPVHKDILLKDPSYSPSLRLEEAEGLVKSLQWEIKASSWFKLHTINPSTLLGVGKLDEIKKQVEETNPETVYFDYNLSAKQLQSLSKIWPQRKVLDRYGLILEIFSTRARTKESKLQVELAKIHHQRTHLLHLYGSQLKGQQQRRVVGTLGGSGETQLEADRRILSERESRIKKELQSVAKSRKVQKSSREGVVPTVSIVGYTNSGKSAFINQVTGANLFSHDMLFASLHSFSRVIRLPIGTRAIFTDTVGFVSDLPHPLVAAFRSTLEDVINSDLIVHVRDITNKESERQKSEVMKVLTELGVSQQKRSKMIEVWNKIDLIDSQQIQFLRSISPPNCFLISALNGDGVDTLVQAIESRLVNRNGKQHIKEYSVRIKDSDGKLINFCYQCGNVIDSKMSDSDTILKVIMSEENYKIYQSMSAQ